MCQYERSGANTNDRWQQKGGQFQKQGSSATKRDTGIGAGEKFDRKETRELNGIR